VESVEALYLDQWRYVVILAGKVELMSIVAKHRHVDRMNAVISSLQLDFSTLTNAFIITNTANTLYMRFFDYNQRYIKGILL